MGAARYVGGKRELNTRALPEYLKRTLSGESAIFQSEELGVEDRARETAVVQIRRADGIERQSFRTQTSKDLDALLDERMAHHVEAGVLKDDGQRVQLTRRGMCLADALAADWL